MRFIDIQVVDAHVLEIDRIVPACFDGVHYLFQFGFQIELAFDTPLHHSAGNMLALCFE